MSIHIDFSMTAILAIIVTFALGFGASLLYANRNRPRSADEALGFVFTGILFLCVAIVSLIIGFFWHFAAAMWFAIAALGFSLGSFYKAINY